MRTSRYHHSLRFKIQVGLLLSLTTVLAVTSYLRYISFRRFLVESLEHAAANAEGIIQAQLAAYLRSRLILSATSIVVVLLIGDLMMSRIVVSRLKRFLRVVARISPGSLTARVPIDSHDEIAELAEAFNRMTEKLQRQDEKLSTLNTLASTVSRSLNLREVLRNALDEVLGLVRLRAGWIMLRDAHGEEFRLAASRGLSEEAALAHTQCNWMRCICAGVFESGQSRVFRIKSKYPCPAAEYLQREGLVFRACVPLKSKDRVLGVMSLAGVAHANMWMFTEDSLETLTAVGRQIGIALENASLYEELRQTETLRRQFLERGLDLLEDERRRIARELHDQTSQRLTSMLMTLGVLGEVESLDEVRTHVRDLRDIAAQTLDEVHSLALELRPRLLDDLGLMAALRHYLGEFRDRYRVPVDLQVLGLGSERLPLRVETALYRVAQEALTNVARHAQAHSVGVLLENRDSSVMLIVEDDGRGFDVPQVMGTHVHEGNLGLHGMRERASLLGGTLTIESAPETGTSVFVEIPFGRGESGYGKDPSPGC
jgi:signal transduction histidine kinase